MEYELWRNLDKSGKLGQIYLLNPKSPLDRVRRKDIIESGGVWIGHMESIQDARQLMEGFTFYRDKTIWELRKTLAEIDKKLSDTRPLSPEAEKRIKAKIMAFKEIFQVFEDIDMERAAAGDYHL